MSNYNIALLERLLKLEKENFVMSNELESLRSVTYKNYSADANYIEMQMFDYAILKLMTLKESDNTIRFLKEHEFLVKANEQFGGVQVPPSEQDETFLKCYKSWVEHFRNLDYTIEYAAS
tara:strand:+ start:81 stop:440 length:360 start_codon:yes stop_codon:yes gene_type:complete